MALEVREKENIKEVSKYVTRPSINEPSKAYVMCVKADALRFANMFREAVTSYLNVLLIDRNNAEAYYGLGVSYKYLQNYEKSAEHLKKALLLKPDDFDTCYELGVVNLLLGVPCAAMQCFVRAIQLDSENSEAQIQLALTHELCEEYDIALMIYQKIIETKPSFIKAYNHKSALLMSLENYREASVVFNQILKLNPDYYRAYFGIGLCFDKLGKRVDSIRYYKKFVERKPNSHNAEFVKKRLAVLMSENSTYRPFRLIK